MRVLNATYPNIIRMALPILLAMLIPQSSYIANAVFLGAYGELELRVIGVAGVFYLIFAMIGQGFGNGLQILMSRRMGERNLRKLSHTFANGIILSLVFSSLLAITIFFCLPAFFEASLRDADNITASIAFMQIRIWGLPFLMLSQLFHAFFIAIQRPSFLIYGALTGTLVNVVLDYLLIFGYGGFPEMGISGAALASVCAEIVACIVSILIYFSTSLKKKFRIYPFYFKPDYKLSRRTLVVASPLIVQFLFGIGGWQIFFIYVEHLGNTELAASQIIRSVYGTAWVGLWALAATTNTMVSNIIGQGKQSRVLYLTLKIASLSLLYSGVISICMWLFGGQILSWFRNDPVLIATALPSVKLVAISTLCMSVSTVLFNAVVGSGNTMINLFIEIICVLTYILYCFIFIEYLRWPLVWAWGSEFAYWLSLLLLAFFYLKSGKWKNKTV